MNNIEITNITKKYPNFTLDAISLSIPKGSIVGLIGENGAGKTTLIKSILQIIKIDSGKINVLNKDIKEVKEDIGVVLDEAFFAEILKVNDIHSIMKNIYKNWDKNLFYSYLQKFKIPENQIIKELSKGMRKKVEIITALSHHPKILILDEPTSGLDPVVRTEILDLFLDFIQHDENSILLSSHITSDLENIADYITFIHEGKIILSTSKDELINEYAILKCDQGQFEKLDKKDIIRFRKNKYSYDVLVKDKDKIKKKYKDFVVDNIHIDDIMLLYIKGEK